MAYTFPGPASVVVKSHEASGKMLVDFARNPKDFKVNKWAQVVPVQKVTGLYMLMRVEEAGRILQTDGVDFTWADGQPAPENNDGLEAFTFLSYRCERYMKGFNLGDITVDQAPWDVVAQHSSIKARQMMTLRTQKAITVATTTGNYDASHVLTVASIVGNTGTWAQSTTARQDIRRSFNTAVELIRDDTLDAIGPGDQNLVLSSSCAASLSQTQEFVDYIKGSPEALAQVRGELPNDNVDYGLPAKLYGVPLVVESTRKVTSAKGATRAVSQVLTAGSPFLASRPGGITGVADSPNFSTIVIFAFEEMTVEQLHEPNNRRLLGRVVENYDVKLIAPASGILFQSAV